MIALAVKVPVLAVALFVPVPIGGGDRIIAPTTPKAAPHQTQYACDNQINRVQ